VTDLLNGDDSDLDVGDDMDDSDSYLVEDDLPIEYSLLFQVPPSTTRIQRESRDLYPKRNVTKNLRNYAIT
jgi:hypothetical protein